MSFITVSCPLVLSQWVTCSFHKKFITLQTFLSIVVKWTNCRYVLVWLAWMEFVTYWTVKVCSKSDQTSQCPCRSNTWTWAVLQWSWLFASLSFSFAIFHMSPDCVPFFFLFYSSFTFHILCDLLVFMYLSLLHFLQVWKQWKPSPFRTYKVLCCFWYSLSTYINFTTANNKPSPSSSCMLNYDVTE